MNEFQFDDTKPVIPVFEKRVVYSERRTFMSSFGSAFGQLLGLFVGVIVCGAAILAGCILYIKFSVGH